VQNGDVVKQTDTGEMWFVIDDTNLGSSSGYTVFTAGTASAVPWSGVTSKPTTVSGYGITDILSLVLTGISTATNSVVLVTDTILAALGKLQAQITAIYNFNWTQVFLMINPAAGYVSPPQRLTRNGTGVSFYFDIVASAVTSTVLNFFMGDRSISLGASLTSSATSMTTDNVLIFSGTPLSLIDVQRVPEVVTLTSGSGTTTIGITRAQGGTTAVAHNSGGYILPYLGNVSVSANTPITWNASGVTGTANDWICYNNTVANSAAQFVITQKWGNR
jgi:hypothetical protein